MAKQRTIKQEWQVVGLSKSHCQREIADKVGLSKSTVNAVQRKYHITLSFGQSFASSKFRCRYDQQRWGLVLEYLYATLGLPLVEVAERCGISESMVKRRLEDLEIPLRTTAEANKGKPRRPGHTANLPPCANGCGRGVAVIGQAYCATCRRARTSSH